MQDEPVCHVADHRQRITEPHGHLLGGERAGALFVERLRKAVRQCLAVHALAARLPRVGARPGVRGEEIHREFDVFLIVVGRLYVALARKARHAAVESRFLDLAFRRLGDARIDGVFAGIAARGVRDTDRARRHVREARVLLLPPVHAVEVGRDVLGLALEALVRGGCAAGLKRDRDVETVEGIRVAACRVDLVVTCGLTAHHHVKGVNGDVHAGDRVRVVLIDALRLGHGRHIRGVAAARRGDYQLGRAARIVEPHYQLREETQLAADRVRARNVTRLVKRQIQRGRGVRAESNAALRGGVVHDLRHLRVHGLRRAGRLLAENHARRAEGDWAAALDRTVPRLAEDKPLEFVPRTGDGHVLDAVVAASVPVGDGLDVATENGRALVGDYNLVAGLQQPGGNSARGEGVHVAVGEVQRRACAGKELRVVGVRALPRKRERLARARRDRALFACVRHSLILPARRPHSASGGSALPLRNAKACRLPP